LLTVTVGEVGDFGGRRFLAVVAAGVTFGFCTPTRKVFFGECLAMTVARDAGAGRGSRAGVGAAGAGAGVGAAGAGVGEPPLSTFFSDFAVGSLAVASLRTEFGVSRAEVELQEG
jgi:hypothetical protein